MILEPAGNCTLTAHDPNSPTPFTNVHSAFRLAAHVPRQINRSPTPQALPSAGRAPPPSDPQPRAQRLWWGHSGNGDGKRAIPSIVDYASAIAAIRAHTDNADANWWLAETALRLDAALSGVRSWRHADNAMRDAFLRGLPPPVWTSPRLNPHPDPLVTAYAELLLDYDACVNAAYATSTYLRRHNRPSNGARHLSRDIRIAIANVPRSAAAVARRLHAAPQPAHS